MHELLYLIRAAGAEVLLFNGIWGGEWASAEARRWAYESTHGRAGYQSGLWIRVQNGAERLLTPGGNGNTVFGGLSSFSAFHSNANRKLKSQTVFFCAPKPESKTVLAVHAADSSGCSTTGAPAAFQSAVACLTFSKVKLLMWPPKPATVRGSILTLGRSKLCVCFNIEGEDSEWMGLFGAQRCLNHVTFHTQWLLPCSGSHRDPGEVFLDVCQHRGLGTLTPSLCFNNCSMVKQTETLKYWDQSPKTTLTDTETALNVELRRLYLQLNFTSLALTGAKCKDGQKKQQQLPIPTRC